MDEIIELIQFLLEGEIRCEEFIRRYKHWRGKQFAHEDSENSPLADQLRILGEEFALGKIEANEYQEEYMRLSRHHWDSRGYYPFSPIARVLLDDINGAVDRLDSPLNAEYSIDETEFKQIIRSLLDSIRGASQ